MDELTDTLSSAFQVSATANNIYTSHPRFDQYKQRSLKAGDQNTRRERYLSHQKKRRFNFQKHARCLALGKWESDGDHNLEKCDGGTESEEMEIETKVRPPKRYKDQLMLSEWLVEVPGDFAENWLMLACPIGKRNLVVASRGRTCCYSKSGYLITTFPSALPGGSSNDHSGYTILDCIFSESEATFYVLDVMCWNNHPFYDSDTEFRFFWLKNKLAETPSLSTIAKNNTLKFVGLNTFPCTQNLIIEALQNEDPKNVDGLLFYHKESRYTFGTTPLVTWLKVHMLPDILDIAPPQAFLSNSEVAQPVGCNIAIEKAASSSLS